MRGAGSVVGVGQRAQVQFETFTRSLNRDAKSSDSFGKCQVWERKAVVINFC